MAPQPDQRADRGGSLSRRRPGRSCGSDHRYHVSLLARLLNRRTRAVLMNARDWATTTSLKHHSSLGRWDKLVAIKPLPNSQGRLHQQRQMARAPRPPRRGFRGFRMPLLASGDLSSRARTSSSACILGNAGPSPTLRAKFGNVESYGKRPGAAPGTSSMNRCATCHARLLLPSSPGRTARVKGL